MSDLKKEEFRNLKHDPGAKKNACSKALLTTPLTNMSKSHKLKVVD